MVRICFIDGRILAMITAVVFFVSSCTITHIQGEKEEPVNLSLDGTWARDSRDENENDDIEIIISGSTGKFLKINSGNWKAARDVGLVKTGDVKIKNITYVSPLYWRCSDLYVDYDANTGIASRIDWEDNCDLVMSEDGKVFSITYTQVAKFSYTFRRID